MIKKLALLLLVFLLLTGCGFSHKNIHQVTVSNIAFKLTTAEAFILRPDCVHVSISTSLERIERHLGTNLVSIKHHPVFDFRVEYRVK